MSRFIKVLFTFLIIAIFAGCSGGSGNTAESNPPTTQGTLITIDNAGIVPVFSNGKTTSIIYVHNNSTNITITGINYSVPQNQIVIHKTANRNANANLDLRKSNQYKQKSNIIKTTNTDIKTSNIAKTDSVKSPTSNPPKILNTITASQCSTLAPMQSCPIQFTTPVLTTSEGQGSMLLTLSYTYNGQDYTFNQIINFQAINNSTNGVYFSSGVNISGFGNSTSYGTVYVYGGGTNQIYTVNSLSSNKTPVTISNGDITGQEIASNFIQAVEVSSPIAPQSTIDATLTTNSTNDQSLATYISTSSVGIYPVNSGGVAGQVSTIDTAESNNPGGSLLISNAGNSSVTLGTSSSTTGISNLSGCTSGTTLNVGQSCTITFNVTQSGGSGTITLNYNGGSSASNITQAITWYNSQNGALVSLSYTNPMNFPQNTVETNTVTVTNIGGFNLTNLTVPTPTVNGNATVTITYPATNSCQNATLNVGESCSYNLNIVDSTMETNKQVVFGISGIYNNGTSQTYTRYAVLTYSTVAFAPTLLITPNPVATMTIEGNNSDTESQVLTVSNVGNTAATISSQGIQSPYNAYFTTTSCPSILESGSNCNITVTLEPYSASQEVSATAVYQILYNGGSSSTLSSTDNIPFVITPDQQSLTIESVTVTGASSGNGTSSSPYIFIGNVTSQIVTLTLTNSGSNPIDVTGIQDINSSLTWSLNLAQSTCSSTDNLQPGDTCTIVYNNVLNQNTLAISGLGSSYTENLFVPIIVFNDTAAADTQFEVQPGLPSGGTTLYATANLATVANSVTVLSPDTANTRVMVQNVLTNATGYNSIIITTKMEDYFSEVSTTVGACSQSSEVAIRTQTCTLSSGTSTGSITYQVESAVIENQSVKLHTLFDLNNSNQVVGMSSTYFSTTIPEK
ncbi:MAG: hypothetical protein QG673_602 [Pseudomonadota bacterium]|nr:hypothetical protein [Pseudomonadota bacterium]